MIFSRQLDWDDYQLIDSGNGQRLERWGKYIVIRPDVTAHWRRNLRLEQWEVAHVKFQEGAGWVKRVEMPDSWLIKFQALSLWAKLTPFKHTGIFPEQAPEWLWLDKVVRNSNRPLNILNLFAYTGVSTLVMANAGANVTHVDASKPAITWMRQNQEASGLLDKPVRFIIDDVMKFVEREIKRGHTYDGIIMDPPIIGHGAKGERWQLTKHLPNLLEKCGQLLSAEALFILVNTYSSSLSVSVVEKMMKESLQLPSQRITSEPLFLSEAKSGRKLKTGFVSTWLKGELW